MSEIMIMSIVKDAIYTGLLVSAPVLIVSLVIGLLISIFQATTQIQEQTLTFVPKLIGIAIVVIVGGSCMLSTLSTFTVEMINMITTITK
ncbi:MAG TPA: flagellar biosynthesis protein FliQ [Peptostreptococcaceae bacterium]|nr:flagellar biosynthesis protein FliQ [Peptostreptococcaceae bacterium]